MSSSSDSIVIVGGGVAGVTAAGALREAGYGGKVTLVECEPRNPYDRPPLSKEVLTREGAENEVALRTPEWYAERSIVLLQGGLVTALHPAEHAISFASGARLSYNQLLLVTGSRARRFLPLENARVPCMYLRTLADALELRAHLTAGRNVVLVGGGVIGMEVAASAIKRGCNVTVIEVAPRIMSRALCEAMSAHLTNYHRSKGVDLRAGASVVGQTTPPEHPGLKLDDNTVVPADVIVIGIGVLPNDELAKAAGIACDDGIVVDEYGATSAADIFAAGDVARYPDAFCGRRVRGESWMHAQHQAAAVARNMVAARLPYRQIPYVWSDQYDLKIQIAGLPTGEVQVTRGNVEANTFILFHLREGRIVGAIGLNSPRDIGITQRLIEARRTVSPEQLRDPSFKLMTALK